MRKIVNLFYITEQLQHDGVNELFLLPLQSLRSAKESPWPSSSCWVASWSVLSERVDWLSVEVPVKLLHHAVPVWDCSIFTSSQLFSYLSDCGFPRCLLLGPTGTNYVKIPTARNYTTGNCSGSYEEDDAGHIKWNPGCEPGFAPLPDPCVDLNYAVVEKKGGGVKEEVGDVSKKALSDRAINDSMISMILFMFSSEKLFFQFFVANSNSSFFL